MSALGRRTVVAEEMLERSVGLPSAYLGGFDGAGWMPSQLCSRISWPQDIMNFTSNHNVFEYH